MHCRVWEYKSPIETIVYENCARCEANLCSNAADFCKLFFELLGAVAALASLPPPSLNEFEPGGYFAMAVTS